MDSHDTIEAQASPAPSRESPGEKARHAFRSPPHNLNCAQAVIYGCSTSDTPDRQALGAFFASGGGRAPQGECGAIFAACTIASDRGENPDLLRERFRVIHGETLCKALRKKQIPCAECVQAAADLAGRLQAPQ